MQKLGNLLQDCLLSRPFRYIVILVFGVPGENA
jgi:hypothetical protein